MEDLRQACDRCHDKKLRCPKLPGSITCSRCARANVPCIFSPPTRPLRPGAHAPSLDWSSFPTLDHDYRADTAWLEPLATPTQPTPDSQPAEDAATRLAETLVALDRLWRLLSSLGFHRDLKHQLEQRADGLICDVDFQSLLEELLALAQSLAALYTDTLGLSVRHVSTGEGEQISNTDVLFTVPGFGHSNGLSSQGGRPPNFDHAMLNLLLACHLRLLDVLDSLVGLAQVCTDLPSSLPTDDELRFDVPEIRIGSFIAPKRTAASIILSTLLDLQAVLAGKSRKLGCLFSPPSADTALTREAKMMRLQSEILGDRADATLQKMKKIKDRLVSAGVI